MSDTDDFERLLSLMGSHVAALNDNLEVLYENRSGHFELGRSILEQLPKPAIARARQAFSLVRQAGGKKSFVADFEGTPKKLSALAIPDGMRWTFCLLIEEWSEEKRDSDERHLRQALAASGVGLWSWHLPTDRIVWDDRMREITGREEPLDLPAWIDELTHPDDRERVRADGKTLTRNGAFTSQLSRIVRADGQTRWILTAGAVIPSTSGEPEWAVGGVMDLTEQQHIAERVREAHRMETLGYLTSGVAHNFNNMLMIIAPCLELIREEVKGELLDEVNDALHAARRAGDIVSQLMTFSGKRNGHEGTTFPAAQLCERIVHLCRRSFPASIELDAHVSTEAHLESTPGVLEQALSNIVFNARDAVLSSSHGGPRVHFEAADVESSEGDFLCITISDNGPGVPEEMRSRIFEPFVTTRPGKGIGLGLASALAIIGQHGGTLRCETSDLGGARFVILLPRVSEAGEVAPESTSRPKVVGGAPTGRNLRILIIDDEPAIRRLLCTGLPRYGYQVTAAEGPVDLEEVLKDSADFDFILLDRSLGAHDGLQLVPLLRQSCQRAKIFLFTGEYIEEKDACTVEGVINKPLNIRALASAIEQTMSA